VDARSDLYSTGAVLYEVATGGRPFEGESSFEVMQAQVERAPVAPAGIEPGIGPALNQVILTALAKDPAKRFQSAAEFSDALERARRELKLARAERGGRKRGGLRVLRSKILWAAATGLAVGAIILAGIVRQPERQAPPPPAPLAAQPVQEAQPVPVVLPEQPPAAEQAPAVEPDQAREALVEAPAPKKVRRAHVMAAPPNEPSPVEQQPARVVERSPARVPEPAAAAAEETVSREEKAPEPVADAASPQSEEPQADAPKKPGNRVWRALGRIARPWKSSKKPEAETPQTPPQ
jgi:serine/threonine-protein kinase